VKATEKADNGLSHNNREFCRCRFIVHTADVSATGSSMGFPGRYIGDAPMNCAPTGFTDFGRETKFSAIRGVRDIPSIS